jgi:hypothetical protein
MIDWYMLLAPLVALPIILLFAFVGCDLEKTGTASPNGKIRLTYSLQKPDTDYGKLGAMQAYYYSLTDPPSVNPYPTVKEILDWTGGGSEGTLEPEKEFAFAEGKFVDINCQLDLFHDVQGETMASLNTGTGLVVQDKLVEFVLTQEPSGVLKLSVL